jgi:hypothetical protein
MVFVVKGSQVRGGVYLMGDEKKECVISGEEGKEKD